MYNPTEVSLHPNKRLALLVTLPWLALAITLLLSAVPFWITLVVMPVLLTGLWRDSQRLGMLRGSQAISALRMSGTALAFRDDTGWQTAEIKSLSRLFAHWTLLTLRSSTSGQTRTIVLCSHPVCSNTNPEALRRLRVWLRLPPNPRRQPGHSS